MKNLIILMMLATTVLFSCNTESAGDSDEYTITGKLTNAGGKSIFLDEMSLNNGTPIDTAIIAEDGSFKMVGKVPERGLYMLRMDQQHSWLMVLDKGEVTFTGDYNDVMAFDLKGNQGTEILNAFILNVGSLNKQIAELNQKFSEARMNGADQGTLMQMQQEYFNLNEEIQTTVLTFADTTGDPLLKVFAASLLDPEAHGEALEKINSDVQAQIPDNELAKQFNEKIAESTKLSIGRMAPDFTLNDPKGNPIKLSDLRGQVVLLDFWASWCKPCRMENPNLVNTYAKYNEEGFTVYSVSLDKNLDQWVAAIQQDNLSWENHASKLQFWNCPVAKQYNVSSIPATFLIDGEGKIIAKNLRGAALEQKLAEVFGS